MLLAFPAATAYSSLRSFACSCPCSCSCHLQPSIAAVAWASWSTAAVVELHCVALLWFGDSELWRSRVVVLFSGFLGVFPLRDRHRYFDYVNFPSSCPAVMDAAAAPSAAAGLLAHATRAWGSTKPWVTSALM